MSVLEIKGVSGETGLSELLKSDMSGRTKLRVRKRRIIEIWRGPGEEEANPQRQRKLEGKE